MPASMVSPIKLVEMERILRCYELFILSQRSTGFHESWRCYDIDFESDEVEGEMTSWWTIPFLFTVSSSVEYKRSLHLTCKSTWKNWDCCPHPYGLFECSRLMHFILSIRWGLSSRASELIYVNVSLLLRTYHAAICLNSVAPNVSLSFRSLEKKSSCLVP